MKVYKFQNLVERESSEISIFWKFSVIALCLSAVIGGMISCIAQGNILNKFNNHCVLFSSLEFKYAKEVLENGTILAPVVPAINLRDSTWGPIHSCETCQFTSVMSIIMGAIWTTLFAMCPRGGSTHSGLPKPWRIVIPAFLFFLAIGVASVVAAAKLQSGFGIFCQQFTEVLNQTFSDITVNDTSCSDSRIDLFEPWDRDMTSRQPMRTHLYIHLSTAGSWISATSWMIALGIQLVRMFIALDFELVTTTVTTKTKIPRVVTHEEIGDGDCKQNLLSIHYEEDLNRPAASV